MDHAFVHDTTEYGTPQNGAGMSASHVIPSDDSRTDEEEDLTSTGTAPPESEHGAVDESVQQDSRAAAEDVPGVPSSAPAKGPFKGSAAPPPPPAWAQPPPSTRSGESCNAEEVTKPEETDVPRAYGERAENVPFVLAEHALRAAEEVRLAGNDAFFAGRFEEAQVLVLVLPCPCLLACSDACAHAPLSPPSIPSHQELYKVAGRHLQSATDLETAQDLAEPGYPARKLECIEKSKLNLAACRIKLGDYMGCIDACNDILAFAPSSVKV